jgi:hypothetical protein
MGDPRPTDRQCCPPEAPKDGPTDRPLCVLVVDDDPDTNATMVLLLELLGHRVQSVCN